VHDQDGVAGVLAARKTGRAQQLRVALGVIDARRDHEHHRVDRRSAGLRAVALDCLSLGLEQPHAVEELGHRVGTVVLATDEDRGLDQAVGDRGGQRIAVDDLLGRRPAVRRCGQADERPRREIANRRRKAGAVVAVVLVGEDDQVVLGVEALVERPAEALLELVRPSALLARRLGERLDGEDEQFDSPRVIHRPAHSGGVEVLRRDDHRVDLHAGEQALGVAARELGDGLVKDRPARGDHSKVACAGARQVLDRAGEDVRLANAGRGVDDALERRRAPIDVEPLRELGSKRLDGAHIRFAKIETAGDRVQASSVEERQRHGASSGTLGGSCVG